LLPDINFVGISACGVENLARIQRFTLRLWSEMLMELILHYALLLREMERWSRDV